MRTLPSHYAFASLVSDADLECVASSEHLRVSVSEEQAVDSYNSTFTCSINMDWDNAILLALWIIQHAPEEDAAE